MHSRIGALAGADSTLVAVGESIRDEFLAGFPRFEVIINPWNALNELFRDVSERFEIWFFTQLELLMDAVMYY